MAEESADELSPTGPSFTEDRRWLRDAEQELAERHTDPEITTKVGKARLAKARTVPGARRRRLR